MNFLSLGIETTCDETAASIVLDGKVILSNVISSQAELHAKYGGVFPEMACRKHIDDILPIIDEALEVAGVTLDQINLISVSKTPGLIGALLIGMNTAKALSFSHGIPFIGVNHVEAHLYSAFLANEEPIPLPALGLVVSGGHTFLCKIEDIGSYKAISSTVDDAVGEAFDKVARMLGLPYPGGPEIEKLAKIGDPFKYDFSIPRVKSDPLAFSFSGLKTQVLYAIQKVDLGAEKANIAASFQRVAVQTLIEKSLRVLKDEPYQSMVIGGGVSQNRYLREALKASLPEVSNLFFPTPNLCIDNAAMIAGLGTALYQKGSKGDSYSLVPSPTGAEKILFS